MSIWLSLAALLCVEDAGDASGSAESIEGRKAVPLRVGMGGRGVGETSEELSAASIKVRLHEKHFLLYLLLYALQWGHIVLGISSRERRQRVQ